MLCVSAHLDACVLCVGGRWLGEGAVCECGFVDLLVFTHMHTHTRTHAQARMYMHRELA